jgi:hypothetical protein
VEKASALSNGQMANVVQNSVGDEMNSVDKSVSAGSVNVVNLLTEENGQVQSITGEISDVKNSVAAGAFTSVTDDKAAEGDTNLTTSVANGQSLTINHQLFSSFSSEVVVGDSLTIKTANAPSISANESKIETPESKTEADAIIVVDEKVVEELKEEGLIEESLTQSIPPLSTSPLTLPLAPPRFLRVTFNQDEKAQVSFARWFFLSLNV